VESAAVAPRTRRTCRRLAPLALFAALLAASAVPAATPPAPTEYQLKAVFLFNFAQFVQWPASAFADARSPFSICVLGEDPFGAYLDDTVRGEVIGERPLMVRRLQGMQEAAACQILFISSSEAARLGDVLEGVEGQPVLTVADFEGSSRRGVIIRFVSVNNRIRFRINVDAARASQLTISSNLLRPAEIVHTGTP
jgi:hypothetical protein